MMTEAAPWWKTAVFYHIYPRSFHDSSGNGVGDLAGIHAKLDYLVELGVDAIWLSPFYPSPMVDFGYDVTDHCDVDPVFGDLGASERLIAAAHQRGLRLILDFVPNHTSIDHPWFLESRSSRDNPRRDWYLWRDPAPDGGPPNNWFSEFGGSAWTLDDLSGQYYLHTFLPQQPDLNWRNPRVAEAMVDVLRFWLDRGVDGFRVDAMTHLVKDANWRDNPSLPGTLPGKDRGEWGRQERRFNSNQPENFQVVRRFRQTLEEYGQGRILAAEVYVFDPRVAVRYFGDGDGCHLVFNFMMLNQPWRAPEIRRAYESLQERIPGDGEMALLLGGHDESRLATRFGQETVRAAAVLLLTLKGTPFIYYGDELGMEDVPVPPERMQDPWPLTSGLPHLSRDPARTPMPWNGGPGAGFSSHGPGGEIPEPWLPISLRAEEINVERQRQDPDSTWNLYRQLLALRRSHPSLRRGQYVGLEPLVEKVWAYLRRSEDETTFIAINLSADPVQVPLKLPSAPTRLLSTVTAPSHWQDGQLALQPFEAQILRL